MQAENILEDNSSSQDYSDGIFYDQNLLDDRMLSANQALDYIEPNLEFEDSHTKSSIDKDKKVHEASNYNYNPIIIIIIIIMVTCPKKYEFNS